VFYETYTFRAELGHAYLIQMNERDSVMADSLGTFDTYLEIYAGSDTAGSPRLVWDDDAGGGRASLNAELYFAAPAAGNYVIRARGWVRSDTGSYSLKLDDCDFQRIDVVGTITGALSPGDCVITSMPFVVDSGVADLHSVHFDLGETKRITMTATSGNATNLSLLAAVNWNRQNAYQTWGAGVPASFTMTATQPGEYLILAGGNPFTATGDYTLTVEPAAGAVADVVVSSPMPSRSEKPRR
jgi:hypothetical protein